LLTLSGNNLWQQLTDKLLLLTLTLCLLQLLHGSSLLNLLVDCLLIHLLAGEQSRPDCLSDIRASPTRTPRLQQASSKTQQTLLPSLLKHIFIPKQTHYWIGGKQAIQNSVHTYLRPGK
jgi:hypothetical protein